MEAADGGDALSALLTLSQPQPQPKPKPKTKTKKRRATSGSRRGWGPFRSVLKERSVDFNLTLDVQSLRQDIQSMVTLRELLQTKALIQREAADGSLLRTVREFYRVFRCGFQAPDSEKASRKRGLTEREQWEFIYSAMDEQLDVGNGLYGNDIMGQQLQNYSTFIRYLCLSLRSFDIISTEDSVVIASVGTFRFQVLRNTIKMIFPHVMSNEGLVGRLIGQQIEVLARLTFYFNDTDKCVKYEVDIDFLAAFADIVKDPHDLDLLFGRALIADNCMFGLLEAPDTPSTAESGTSPTEAQDVRPSSALVYQDFQHSHHAAHPTAIVDVCEPPAPNAEAPKHIQWAKRLAQTYFAVFSPPHSFDAQGLAVSEVISEQRFLDYYCDPCLLYRHGDKWLSIEEKWSVFRWCFDILEFQQVENSIVRYEPQLEAHRVHVVGVYDLGISSRTLELVFPHVQSYPRLVEALLHRSIRVESQLRFLVADSAGKVSRIDEDMELESALAALLPHPKDLEFVLHEATANLDRLLLGNSHQR